MTSPFLRQASAFLHARRVLLLLVALWFLTLPGIQSIPLETHEAFVLATAQEMKTGGDWILPRFNNELRLQKPPLSYWATIGVSSLDPTRSHIQIYHGRLVSLLALLFMVLLTARTGEKLYGKETGILAAMLLMCTGASLEYSHNAKPDFLYAALCTLQLFAWIDAWRADTPAGQRRGALLGWAAAGLATLAKGPQVPAVFLLGLIIFLAAGPDRRRLLKILRPLSGTVLFALLALPWWLLLQHRLRTFGADIADSQLSGSLLCHVASWKELLSLYYVWMSAAKMFPASLLLLLLLPQLRKERASVQPSTRLLVIASLTMLVLFMLAGHYRKHYILPLLPVFSILLANGARLTRFQGVSEKWQKPFCAAGLAAAAAGAGCLVWSSSFGTLALFSGAGVLSALLLKQELAATFAGSPVFTKQLLVTTAALTLFGIGLISYSPATHWPKVEQEFKKCAGERLSRNDRLVCWKISASTLPFFVKQPVAAFTDPDQLMRFVAANLGSHPIFAIMPAREIASFSERYKNQIMQTAVNKHDPAKSLHLVEIRGVRKSHPSERPRRGRTRCSPAQVTASESLRRTAP